MKPTELVEQCVTVLKQQPGLPFIVVIGRLPAKGWPRGECIGSDSRGQFFSYDARKLLVRLMALGVCTIEITADLNMKVMIGKEVHDIELNDTMRDGWIASTKSFFAQKRRGTPGAYPHKAAPENHE